MILLSGGDLVLPDRVVGGGCLVIEDDRITDILPQPRRGGADTLHFDLQHHYIVPGFIDVHVHGIEGVDTLDGSEAIGSMAERLPRYGVTAFCPTSLACAPDALREMLAAVRTVRTARPSRGARVLPAHLESNFINPEFKGAQPLECLRLPPATRDGQPAGIGGDRQGAWTGREILDEITTARPDVGIITIASELDGALELIRELVARGHSISLGHSGATYEQALEGVKAGARQATHLFNRMMPMAHRAPGLTGAVLESDEVVAELVCDGFHVHPAAMRVALAAKRPERVMAITDGTAGSGLERGMRTRIGGRPIKVGEAAYLDDGTLAGSVLTMDRAFANLATRIGLSLVDTAVVCSTTPARALGLQGFGVIAAGAMADLVVLDREFRVVQTWIAGSLAYDARGQKGGRNSG
jgi:N-acetylglucosamine-6-phosphate deacetylase